MAYKERQERSDGQLLRAVEDGDSRAFELLYRRYEPWLVARLTYRCPDAGIVDDVVQETFLALWRGSARYREQEGADAAGWLWRIASRRLVDLQRGHGARQRLLQVLGRFRHQAHPSAEDEALLGLPHGELAQAMRKLPVELRAVLQATVVEGLTTAEAAEALRIPPGTVKTRAMRARRRLRKELA
ncbi:RNA polymerase sigma factor [Streptomyces sp. NPDC001843]|uniref:RNA polymerase sigma factor n=1 Tax=Streptomyces sp. NPDC001843 TaxID=3364617 RepID=UPI0036C11193